MILNEEGFRLLRTAGFDVRSAAEISERYPSLRIRRQIEWMTQRRPSRNPLGMLRRAIEQDWSPPAGTGKGAVGYTQLQTDPSHADQDRRDLLREQAAQLTNRFKL